MARRRTSVFVLLAVLAPAALALVGCAPRQPVPERDYGVFIGLSPEDAPLLAGYDTVVVDAEYFSAEEIEALTGGGTEVYSYINIGSVESFRDYFSRFEDLTLSVYENWPDERWVDVSEPDWQEFVCEELSSRLADKGITGFFADNADVYYHYREDGVYLGLLTILNGLKQYGLDVVINGGDTFVSEAIERGDIGRAGVTGVNQENVYTVINFEKGASLGRQTEEETAYFKDYLSLCEQYGLKIFITEYAEPSDAKLRNEIAGFCDENGYAYYIASSPELDGR